MAALLDEDARQGPLRPASRYQRIVRLLSKPRAALGIAAVAFFLSLPALAIGLTADDFDLALAVRDHPLSAYAFQARDPVQRHGYLLAAREAGSAPWWIDLEFHQAFLRPVSSLSLALDFALWPSAAWLMHLENSLLFGLIVLLAASLYRAFGLPPRARGVATAFFAMQGAQSMTTGWISGRNTLLATLFGFLTVRLFVAAQSRGRGLLRFGAAWLAFAAALLSAEAGVAAIAYVFAYAVTFGATAVPTSDDEAPGQRVRVAGPPLRPQLALLSGFALVLIVWLAAYKLGGYGVKNSGFYVDPGHDPVRYLLDLLTAIPIYLASQLTVPFAASAEVAPLALPIVTLSSVAILFASRPLWQPWVKEDSRARTLAVGAFLSIVPLGASPPQDRMVSFVALGICGLLALIVEERLGTLRTELPKRGALRLLRLHAIWAPLLYVPFLFGCMSMIAGGGGVALDRTLGDDTRPVILVNAPSHLPVHFFASKRTWFGQPYPPIDLLYGGGAEVELTRTAEHSFELTAARGYFASRFERIERDPRRRPLSAGQVIGNSRLRAHILEVRDGAPTRVRFDFAAPLANARIYTWQGRSIEALALPKLGERVRVRAASAL